MSIQQFGSLYKAFMIYPNSVVENYLRQYAPPNDIKISEPTWRSFFGNIVTRFIGARHHGFLYNFLDTVSCAYVGSQRKKEFVFDLLNFKVPKLFALDPEECDEETIKEDTTVRQKFTKFLHNFIESNALKNTIVTQIKLIIVSYTKCMGTDCYFCSKRVNDSA